MVRSVGAMLLSLFMVASATVGIDHREDHPMAIMPALHPQQPQAGICGYMAANCTRCTSYTVSGTCGWCGKTKQCLEGGPKGPYFGKCGSGWVAEPNKCPAKYDPCTKYASDCASCTTGSPDGVYSCGWCHSSKKCMAARRGTGPIFGTCPIWSYRPFSCPGYVSSCAAQTNCSTCTEDPLCVWCESSQTCMDGTAKGPKSGQCPYWTYSGAVCLGTQASLTTCTDCVNYDQSVWCRSTSTCLPGGFAGPKPGYTCDDWILYYEQCPIDATNPDGDVCKDYDNCASCTADYTCGWCASSQKCLVGRGSQPNFETCDDWRPMGAACAAKLSKTIVSCNPGFNLSSCPVGDFSGVPTSKICATSTCTAAECCSNTCASFSKKCPTGTVKKSISNYACQYYTCTTTECCEGICSKVKCPSGTKRVGDRTCFGRQCLKDDCCRSTCKTFKASNCPSKALVANASKTYCNWYKCTAAECCKP